MKPTLPPTQWLVYTPHAVNGTHWHNFKTRRERNAFANANHGYRYDVRRAKK